MDAVEAVFPSGGRICHPKEGEWNVEFVIFDHTLHVNLHREEVILRQGEARIYFTSREVVEYTALLPSEEWEVAI